MKRAYRRICPERRQKKNQALKLKWLDETNFDSYCRRKEDRSEIFSISCVLLPDIKGLKALYQCNGRFQNALFYLFFLDLLKEVESSLRTNRDCLASLKCRTPCQNRHYYRLNHPPRKTRPKTTQVKAKSL